MRSWPFRLEMQVSWRDDDGFIAGMRLLLALAVLAIVIIDPSDTGSNPTLTYFAILAYVLYSVGVYVLALRRSAQAAAFLARSHWFDVAWYSLFIALGTGTQSIFFSGLYFCIITASFRWGFLPGLKTAVASALCFGTIGISTSFYAGSELDLDRLLLRMTWLLVLGYMVAHWGGREILAKRRLDLLKV